MRSCFCGKLIDKRSTSCMECRKIEAAKKRNVCNVSGCMRSTQKNSAYCYHHSRACACGARITKRSSVCFKCLNKASEERAKKHIELIRRKRRLLDIENEILSIIEAYTSPRGIEIVGSVYAANRASELMERMKDVKKSQAKLAREILRCGFRPQGRRKGRGNRLHGEYRKTETAQE